MSFGPSQPSTVSLRFLFFGPVSSGSAAKPGTTKGMLNFTRISPFLVIRSITTATGGSGSGSSSSTVKPLFLPLSSRLLLLPEVWPPEGRRADAKKAATAGGEAFGTPGAVLTPSTAVPDPDVTALRVAAFDFAAAVSLSGSGSVSLVIGSEFSKISSAGTGEMIVSSAAVKAL